MFNALISNETLVEKILVVGSRVVLCERVWRVLRCGAGEDPCGDENTAHTADRQPDRSECFYRNREGQQPVKLSLRILHKTDTTTRQTFYRA